MNREENRLQSFSNWPVDAAVSPIRIAKAGFYSLNRDLSVQCFSCGVQITEWNYGDQAMARHRQLNPECAFVLNPITSGNIRYLDNSTTSPVPSSPDSSDAPHTSNSLFTEGARLLTFNNWPVPHIVTPERLARAGFYYLQQSDKTQCVFCRGIVVQWEVGDDPDIEHKRHFPLCAFVQRVIIPRIENTVGSNLDNDNYQEFTNVNIVGENSFNDLGINAHRRPKKSKYSTLESRSQTFASWPDDLIQTPNALAQAGFYYEGFGDQVRCFHCDGGLRHWDPQDDPWTEHCRWFPECPYVLLVKGQKFVSACALETGEMNSEQESRRTARPFQHTEVTEHDIQTQMLTPEVIAALNVGLHVGRIKQAIKEKLEQTGTGFSTADAVIEAALNVQRDEEDTPENTQISQEVARILTDAVAQTIVRSVSTPELTDANETPIVSTSTAVQEEVKIPSLEEENRVLKEARLCKICMDVEVGIVFLPCGHLTTCVNCAPNLEYCPVCRCTIKATVRTFLS